MYYRILSSTSAFSALNAHSACSSGCDNQNVLTLSDAPGKQNLPWLRILALHSCPIHLSYFLTTHCCPCSLYSSNMVVFSSSDGPSSFSSLETFVSYPLSVCLSYAFLSLTHHPHLWGIPQDFSYASVCWESPWMRGRVVDD